MATKLERLAAFDEVVKTLKIIVTDLRLARQAALEDTLDEGYVASAISIQRLLEDAIEATYVMLEGDEDNGERALDRLDTREEFKPIIDAMRASYAGGA